MMTPHSRCVRLLGPLAVAGSALSACASEPDPEILEITGKSQAALVTPTLVGPAGGGIGTQPTYRFAAVAGATRYWLWVNDVSGVRINVVHPASTFGCAGGGVCSITPATTLSPGAARWWVQAQSDMDSSAWSPPLSFTAEATAGSVPPAPTLTAPVGTVSTSTPEYRWSAASTATEYSLWVTDALGTRVQQSYTAAAVGCAAGGSCFVRPSTALNPGNARFWVQAKNGIGASAWSAPLPFFVPGGGTPSIPSLTGPTGTLTTNNPTYQWSAAPSATHYNLWVDDSAGTRIRATYTAAAAGCAASGACSVTPSTAVVNGLVRFWVQAQNGAGTSNWSLVRSFTVQNSACFGEFGPAGAIKIVEVHHRVGFPAYFRIRNTHPSCPVNLKALYVFDNSVPGFGYFYEMSLWDRWLNPGAELLGGNPAGRSLEHLSVPYSGPNDQRYLGLCLGRCIYDDSSNVTDAVVLALPNVPPPIFGVSMDTPLTRPVRNDFQSFVRVAFNGAAPVFSNADWTLGPATATPCRASLATGQTCDVPFNGYAGMVCQSPSRSCTCTETARDVYTWICAP